MSFKFSKETIAVLKNFASINPNIVFNARELQLQTIADAKNIFASYKMPEGSQIPLTFGIYDLNEFLSVLSMFEDEPELLIKDSMMVIVSDESGDNKVKYFFADQSILTTPDNNGGVKMPVADFTFKLSTYLMNQIRKASSTLGLPHLVITQEGSKTIARVCDTKEVTSNSCEFKLDASFNAENAPLNDFTAVFSIANLKMQQDEYIVSVSGKGISHFSNTAGDVQYWIALEKTSKFN